MKIMRSRFRLISLLLTCVFLLTAVICAVTALKQAGVALPSVQQTLKGSSLPSPESSLSLEEATPAPDPSGDENVSEETTIQPDSEYNIFGL